MNEQFSPANSQYASWVQFVVDYSYYVHNRGTFSFATDPFSRIGAKEKR